jgi:hypothetical protein
MVELDAIYLGYGEQEIICLFCFPKKLVRSSAETMCLLACLFLLIGRDSRKVLEGADNRKEGVLQNIVVFASRWWSGSGAILCIIVCCLVSVRIEGCC